jgi:hypothetical protein
LHDCLDAGIEQFRIAAELVDEEAVDARALVRFQHRMGADETGDHAAAVDIAGEHHRYVGRGSKSHVGDVAHAQIDLGRATGTFHDNDVGLARELREALQHDGQKRRLAAEIVRGAQRTGAAAAHDDLCAGVALRFQQHGVHVNARCDAGGTSLQRLSAADFAAIDRNRCVVRHVLRFEWHHTQSAQRQQSRKTCDQR